MGNCSSQSSSVEAPVQSAVNAQSNRQESASAYYDALYGPSTAPHPSPYHPKSQQPIQVPTLFQLALEQLCVSLVDQQSLDRLIDQQTRKRRSSIPPPAEASGGVGSGSITPHTPVAAMVWGSTPPVEKGYNGATRRYSNADLETYPVPAHLLSPSKKKSSNDKSSVPSSPFGPPPRSPFHAHNALLHSPAGNALVSPTLKRGRSFSLSSKESPELQPQSYRTALGQRMISTGTVGGSRRDSIISGVSSAGSSPFERSMGLRSVPTSPVWMGTPYTNSPNTDGLSYMSPIRLQRSGSTPQSHAYSAHQTDVTTSPLKLASSWMGMPEAYGARLLSTDSVHSNDLSTSTLLTGGSMGYACIGGVNRQLRLPESIIQLIFDRLIEEELLTHENIYLFTHCNLSRMDFSGSTNESEANIDSTNSNAANINSKYSQELTDDWLHVLFENIVRHYQTMQSALNQTIERERKRHKTNIDSIGEISSSTSPTALQSAGSLSSPSPPPLASSSAPPSASVSPVNNQFSLPFNDAPTLTLQPSSFNSPTQSPPSSIPPRSLNDKLPLSPGPILTDLRLSNLREEGIVTANVQMGSLNSLGQNSILEQHRKQSITEVSMDESTVSPNAQSNDSPPAIDPTHILLSSLESLTHTPHRVDSIPLGPSSSVSAPPLSLGGALPTLHNPLSITSPSPSLALYRHAPSLTALNLSGCYQITNRSLQPLQVCLMLTDLNFNGCTQLSDELLMCVLANKYYLESLQLKGLKGITDATLSVLGDKTKLRRLYLDSCSITDAGLLMLSGLRHLHYFSVGWCGPKVTNIGIDWIGENRQMRILGLASTGVKSIQFIQHMRFLRELNLSGCQLHNIGLTHSASFPYLTNLYLPRTPSKEIPLALLQPSILTFDLSFSSGITAAKLVSHIEQWATHQQASFTPLVLENSPAVSTVIAEGTLSRSPSSLIPSVAIGTNDLPISTHLTISSSHTLQLRTLLLESCCIDNRVASAIGENCPNLTHLNVADTHITSNGLLALAPLKQLRTLNFSGCKVHNHGLRVLANFTLLQELYMDCPNLSDPCLIFLRPLAPTLTRLDVFETPLTEHGLEHILALKKLIFLEFCNGRLSNFGLNRIATNLTQLTSLNISQNKHINDLGLQPLSLLKHLVHLNLSGTSATHNGLSFLNLNSTSISNLAPTSADSSSTLQSSGEIGNSLRRISLFGCNVRPTSAKVKQLPTGIQLGLDAGIVSIE